MNIQGDGGGGGGPANMIPHVMGEGGGIKRNIFTTRSHIFTIHGGVCKIKREKTARRRREGEENGKGIIHDTLFSGMPFITVLIVYFALCVEKWLNDTANE